MLIVDPQTHDIVIDSGCQEKIQFTMTNVNGLPYDPGIGALFSFIVKESLDDAIGAAKINLASNVNPTQFDLTMISAGIFTVELIPANTSALGGKTYHYGIRIVD